MQVVLWDLVKAVWDMESLPATWKLAEIVPILKKGDPLDPCNYRPISLVNCVAKLLAAVVQARLEKVVCDLGLLTEEQAGFRPGQEGAHHVVALHEVLRRRQLAGKRTYVCFIDFKQAFDSVPHKALIVYSFAYARLLGMNR